MIYINDVNLENKKIIVRFDYNCPVENGVVVDSTKIDKSLKTINYLLNQNCSIIILSHFGRVNVGEDKKDNSLYPVYECLKSKVEVPVTFLKDPVGMDTLKKCKNIKEKEIILLENTRYCDIPEKLESKNDDNLSRYWASLGDAFIVDAFASLHRLHASVAGIAKYLPTYYGFLVKEELEGLSPVIENINKPFVVFMGGKKVEDKIKYIKDILKRCDYLLLGGAIANSFLYSAGYDVGKSLVTTDQVLLEELRMLMKEYPSKIALPVDFNIVDGKIMDLGIKTVEKYLNIVNKCDTLFINGTLGVFEDDMFAIGTKKFLEGINCKVKIAGGGDTVNAINKFKLSDKFSFISTGGGASLEYVSSGKLKALEYISEL